MTNKAIQKITYHFGDASVPPPDHRSYVITVTKDNVGIIVDSYGEVLAEKTHEITSKQFDDIQASLERNEIRNCILGDNEGCTGGTSESIFYSSKEKEMFSGSVYHCGGNDTGNLCGNIKHFVDDVKKMVPDIKKLLK